MSKALITSKSFRIFEISKEGFEIPIPYLAITSIVRSDFPKINTRYYAKVTEKIKDGIDKAFLYKKTSGKFLSVQKGIFSNPLVYVEKDEVIRFAIGPTWDIEICNIMAASENDIGIVEIKAQFNLINFTGRDLRTLLSAMKR